MGKLFGPDSILFAFLTKIADLIILNVLWIIGCIPIVTIGASTIALYYCAEKYRVNDALNLLRTFWNAYRSNLKQSFALMGIMLLVMGTFAADFILLYRIKFEIPEVILGVIGVALLLSILAMGYIFPLQAHFDNTVRKTTINAVIMSILHLPKSLLVAILNLLPIGLLFFLTDGFLPFVIIWLFIGGSGIAYINNTILQSIFKRYYDHKE